jgi:polyisoprenoid-binding protein YceI
MRFTRSRMTVPVRSFDCGSKPISKDFWKTLKAETYPEMNIDFISLQNVYFKNNSHIDGVVDITLAGVTTRYTIKYFVIVKNNGTVLLQGTHAVNFSDFQLEAPKKLNGLIKVKEALKVDFNLLLKEV